MKDDNIGKGPNSIVAENRESRCVSGMKIVCYKSIHTVSLDTDNADLQCRDPPPPNQKHNCDFASESRAEFAYALLGNYGPRRA